MITAYSLVQFLYSPLVDPAANHLTPLLHGWSRRHFGRLPHVQIGDDPNRDMTQWRLPGIALFPEQDAGGRTQATDQVRILVELRLRDPAISRDGGGPDTSSSASLDALARLAEMHQVVHDLCEQRLAETSVDMAPRYAWRVEARRYWPIVVGELRLQLTVPAIIGVTPSLS